MFYDKIINIVIIIPFFFYNFCALLLRLVLGFMKGAVLLPKQEKRPKPGDENEPELGDPGEASPRSSGAHCHGGAEERRALPGQHDRVRGQLELPARKHHLYCQGPRFPLLSRFHPLSPLSLLASTQKRCLISVPISFYGSQ